MFLMVVQLQGVVTQPVLDPLGYVQTAGRKAQLKETSEQGVSAQVNSRHSETGKQEKPTERNRNAKPQTEHGADKVKSQQTQVHRPGVKTRT